MPAAIAPSPQEVKKSLMLQLKAEQKVLEKLEEEVAALRIKNSEALDYFHKSQEQVRDARGLAERATADLQKAQEASSESQGKINRMRGELSAVVGRETGGVSPIT